MLKQIPKSDISFRPFKVYKTFTPTEQSIPADLAVNHTGSTDQLTDSELHQQGLWHQLRTMYYNGDNALNPFMSYGTFKPNYTNVETGLQRSLKDRAFVLSIPQIEFGEQIKPNSVYLQNSISIGNEEIYDDGYGNLISTYSSYFFNKIDIETNEFWFTDANNTVIKTNILTLDIENNLLLVQNEDTFYLIKIDVEEGSVSFLGIFKETNVNASIIGNVFYSHGIITITRETQLNGIRETALTNYNLEYKSTNTIYENEYLLVVGEDEFNVSTNPTSYTENNVDTGTIYVNALTKYQIDATRILLPANGGFVLYIDDSGNEVTLAIDENIIYNFYAREILENNLIGCSLQNFKQETVKWRNSDKYQRTTLNNPYISAVNGVSASGFDVYEYSSSVDPTGSYLAPYITTIGLYDDNMDMVAVAKLAKPVKSTPDLPVNFLVRFDS
jgi:hypothetical protein